MVFSHIQYIDSQRKRTMAITVALTIVVGVIIFSGHPSQAQTVIPLSACTTISTSGSYQIVADITTSATACFLIAADNVTLDGNNKTVTVNGTSGADPVYAVDIKDLGTPVQNWHDIIIKNLNSNVRVRTFGDGVNHVTFQNLQVKGIDVLGSDDVVVSDNTVGEGGIQINNAGREPFYPLRPVVTGNTLMGGSTDVKTLLEVVGGLVDPCPQVDAVVDHNTITDTRGDPPPEATAAVRIRCATNSTFTDNTVRSTETTIGLYLRDESDYGRYENNSFWSNHEVAIRISSGNADKTYPAHNTFRNNTFRSDDSTAMYLPDISHGNVFQDNVFWGTASGLAYISGGYGNVYDHNTFYVIGTGSLTNLTYRYGPPPDSWTNNIFNYSSTSLFGYDGWVGTSYSGDYNLFYNRSGAVSFGSRGASLEAWRSNNNSDNNSIEDDPMFVNPTAGDYTLQPGSPAINAASDGTDIGARQTVASCSESWTCGEWSACNNNSQTRVCTDANLCGTTTDRPALTQACSCAESWSCGEWSVCNNNTQARTCADANSCGTTIDRPALTQACTEQPAADTTAPAAVNDLMAS